MYHFLIRWVDSSSSLTFVDLAFTDLYLLRSKLLFRMRMQLAVVLLYDCQNINVDDEDGTRSRVTTALCSMNQSRTTNFTRWALQVILILITRLWWPNMWPGVGTASKSLQKTRKSICRWKYIWRTHLFITCHPGAPWHWHFEGIHQNAIAVEL